MKTILDYSNQTLYDEFPEGGVVSEMPVCRNIRMFLRHAPLPEADIFSRNVHDMAILFICLSGRGNLFFNGTVCELRERDAVLILPRQPHFRLPLAGEQVEYLVIRFDGTPEEFFTPLNRGILHIDNEAEQRLNQFIEAYQRAWTEKTSEASAECGCLLALFINSLHDSAKGMVDINVLPKRMSRAIKILFARGNEYRSIYEIADELGITPNYLRMCFKEHVGWTPNRLRQMNLKFRAEQMLANSDLSIGEIAEQLNFGSIHSFSRFFHRVDGCSPTEFRRKFDKP